MKSHHLAQNSNTLWLTVCSLKLQRLHPVIWHSHTWTYIYRHVSGQKNIDAWVMLHDPKMSYIVAFSVEGLRSVHRSFYSSELLIANCSILSVGSKSVPEVANLRGLKLGWEGEEKGGGGLPPEPSKSLLCLVQEL